MNKPSRVLNYYEYKTLLLEGKPHFDKFVNQELIRFCEIAQELLLRYKNVLKEMSNFCGECPSKECCPEDECIIFRIEKIINEDKR